MKTIALGVLGLALIWAIVLTVGNRDANRIRAEIAMLEATAPKSALDVRLAYIEAEAEAKAKREGEDRSILTWAIILILGVVAVFGSFGFAMSNGGEAIRQARLTRHRSPRSPAQQQAAPQIRTIRPVRQVPMLPAWGDPEVGDYEDANY